MDRVEREECISILKTNVDDHKVMNVVKIIPETLFGNGRMDIPNCQVPRGADPNLICNVPWKNKLAIIPRKFKLSNISLFFFHLMRYNYPLSMDIDVIALCVVQKVLSSRSFNK